MKIANGGSTDFLSGKITEITVGYNDTIDSISLWINQDSLSYLSLDEAIILRNELNEAIKKAAGI